MNSNLFTEYTSFEIEKNDIKTVQRRIEFPIAYCAQTHQDRIFLANQIHLFDEEADAIITQEKNLPLLIQTADCLAIQLFDPIQNVIANIHAGWRGQSKQIITKTIRKCIENFRTQPERIFVTSSPSLGVCCAHFSDPFHELPKWMHPFITKDFHVDLKKALKHELLQNNILEENMLIDARCSCCSPENFPSYRRDKSSKRTAHLIWLK